MLTQTPIWQKSTSESIIKHQYQDIINIFQLNNLTDKELIHLQNTLNCYVDATLEINSRLRYITSKTPDVAAGTYFKK